METVSDQTVVIDMTVTAGMSVDASRPCPHCYKVVHVQVRPTGENDALCVCHSCKKSWSRRMRLIHVFDAVITFDRVSRKGNFALNG